MNLRDKDFYNTDYTNCNVITTIRKLNMRDRT